MIVFDLTCTCGFQFEAWFHNHQDYDKQQESGLLECPDCSGNEIHKILSPVVSMRSTSKSENQVLMPKISEEQAAKDFFKGLKKYVEKNFDDVGTKLADTALKIHYGVEENRNVRGVATDQEEKMLAKEGIELLKIPMPNDENEEEN